MREAEIQDELESLFRQRQRLNNFASKLMDLAEEDFEIEMRTPSRPNSIKSVSASNSSKTETTATSSNGNIVSET
ncbi:unnamed protein product [Soboliphyme baturini]|uniref:Uncharacterized protein n=1 Tax=Soboliphyme baturini TaxID=241478 RepID=A0A183J9B1_9BILA|nr:unnamed protein product [Soboliphyme baturini]